MRYAESEAVNHIEALTIGPFFQTGAAVALLGITHRQLDHAVKSGEFPCAKPATGSGSVRWFSIADLLTIRGVLERRQIAEELWPGKRRAG